MVSKPPIPEPTDTPILSFSSSLDLSIFASLTAI
jgi:hypothetical protein